MYALIDHNSLIEDTDIPEEQLFIRIEGLIILIHKLFKVRGYTTFLRASYLETTHVCPTHSFKSILRKMFEDRREGEAFDRMSFFQTILDSAWRWDEILRQKYRDYVFLDSNGQDCSQTVFACASVCDGVVVKWLANHEELAQAVELWVANNNNDDPHQVYVECIFADNQVGRFYRPGRHRHGENAFTDAELRRRSNRSIGSDFDLNNIDAQYVLNLGIMDSEQEEQNNRLVRAVYKGQVYYFNYDQNEDRTKVIIGYSETSQMFYEFRFDNVGGYHGYIIKPNWSTRQKKNLILKIASNRHETN